MSTPKTIRLGFIFGRTPQLALRELEAAATSLPFQWSLSSVQSGMALLKLTDELLVKTLEESGFESEQGQQFLQAVEKLQNRLGGTLRILFLTQEAVERDVEAAFYRIAGELVPQEGKITFGIGLWGKGLRGGAVGRRMKQTLQNEGFSARFVMAQRDEQLSSAQVLHNKLDYMRGRGKKVEFAAIEDKGIWYGGFTLTVQNIEEYRVRDFSIPFPDPVSGMLSPKLAQIMVNLATQGEPVAVYDPFCGNGRIVLEASNMGLSAYGSDIVPKKVDSAQKNLQWLVDRSQIKIENPETLLWVADATLSESREKAEQIMTIPWVMTGEPFLGRPLRAPLRSSEKQAWLAELIPLYLNFFKNWSTAKNRPQRMLMVIPRAKVEGGGEAALYDQIVDRLGEFGYSSEVLFCYDRPDSFVRRDLVQVSFIDR